MQITRERQLILEEVSKGGQEAPQAPLPPPPEPEPSKPERSNPAGPTILGRSPAHPRLSLPVLGAPIGVALSAASNGADRLTGATRFPAGGGAHVLASSGALQATQPTAVAAAQPLCSGATAAGSSVSGKGAAPAVDDAKKVLADADEQKADADADADEVTESKCGRFAGKSEVKCTLVLTQKGQSCPYIDHRSRTANSAMLTKKWKLQKHASHVFHDRGVPTPMRGSLLQGHM